MKLKYASAMHSVWNQTSDGLRNLDELPGYCPEVIGSSYRLSYSKMSHGNPVEWNAIIFPTVDKMKRQELSYRVNAIQTVE